MVAINYAKDIRVGEQPVKAAALGNNFVWPPLPERLFLRGQSLVYDFIKQRYGVRRPGYFTLVAGASISGIGYISEEFAVSLGDPEMTVGSISGQPVSGFNLLGIEFADAGSVSQLTAYFQGDVEESLAGIRVWVGGVEIGGPPFDIMYVENYNATIVAYANPIMDPWVDGGQYTIGITLDGQELPEGPFDYTSNVNDLGIVTRASAATYWGPEGSLLEAAVDEARIQHDPVMGEALGLLVESEATNWVSDNTSFSLISADFSSVDDTDPVMGSVVRVTAVAAGEASAGSYMSFGVYPIPNGSMDASPGILRVIYAKPVTADYVSVRQTSGPAGLTVKLSTAEIVQSYPSSTSYVKALAGGWVQIAYHQPSSATSNGSSTDYRLLIGSNPKNVTNGQGIEYAVGDEVLLAYPSMYQAVPEGSLQSIIPTVDSPVTRAADDAVVDLTDVLNPDEGTYVVRAVVKDDGEIEYYAGYYHLTVSSRLSFRRLANGNFIFRVGSLFATMSPPVHLKSGDVVTLAVAYNEGQIIAAAFGETSTSSSNYSPVETVNLVRGVGAIPSDNDRSLRSSGIIAGFEYYPRALIEEELARITAFTPGDNS